MKLASSFLMLICAFFLAACGGGDSVPLDNAAEVEAAFDAEPFVLQSWYSQTGAARGDVVMMLYPVDLFLPEPFHLVVFYKGRTIYDEQRWGISERHAVMQDGTDVVLVNESIGPPDSGTSVVFVNGEKIPKLQSLPARLSGQNYPAAVRDIREWRDGWLIISASYIAPWGSTINRWAMYRPKTQEFIDCGEYGSSRLPDEGPPASSVCRHR